VLARILVVEDEVDTRMVLGKFLSVAGHEVIPAANGWEALLVLDTTSVDLILLDVMMPGMDGVTFLQILRQAKKHKEHAGGAGDGAGRRRRRPPHARLWRPGNPPKTQRLLDDLMKTVHRIVGHTAAPGAHPSGVSPGELSRRITSILGGANHQPQHFLLTRSRTAVDDSHLAALVELKCRARADVSSAGSRRDPP
jgi:hypothetical protein